MSDQSPAEKFLTEERAIDVGSVKQIDAEIECLSNRENRFALICCPVRSRHSHAPESDSGGRQAETSNCALFHVAFTESIR